MSLVDFCVAQFSICDFPDSTAFVDAILRSGKAIVLFDGLDEVNQEGEARAKMIRMLVEFSDKYQKSQICMTCRVASSDYVFTSFSCIQIADFDDHQKSEFIKKALREIEWVNL